jgi:hypothetical protein
MTFKPLLFSFLVFTVNLTAQNFEKYCIENLASLTKTNDWKKKTTKPPKSDQERILRVAFQDSSFAFSNVSDQSKLPDSIQVEGHWDSAFIAQHYFIDIDNDKDLDVVFDGAHYVGSTEGNVDVYVNKKGKFTKAISTNGKLTFVLGKIDSAYALVIYRYPVGNRIEHGLEGYTCEKDKLNPMASLTFFGEVPTGLAEAGALELPFNTLIKISTKSPKAPSFVELGPLKQVNQWKQTVPVKYYSTLKDKFGEDWYFIKIKSKELVETKYPEWKTVLAWMKKQP